MLFIINVSSTIALQREFWLRVILPQRAGLTRCLPAGHLHFLMVHRLTVVWALPCLHVPLLMAPFLQPRFLRFAHHRPKSWLSHQCRYQGNHLGRVNHSNRVKFSRHPSCLRLQCSNLGLLQTCRKGLQCLKGLFHLQWGWLNRPLVGGHHPHPSRGRLLCIRDPFLPLPFIMPFRCHLIQVDQLGSILMLCLNCLFFPFVIVAYFVLLLTSF